MRTRLFAGLPTRPVYYLALVLFVLAASYYYGTAYRDCTAHATLRDRVGAVIERSGGANTSNSFRLSAITDFAWDRADILVNFKPDGTTADCPFGWDWSREKRDALVADDLLTVVVFSQSGNIVNYLEYRRDWADFLDVANPYTPSTAVFKVRRSPTDPPTFILTPQSLDSIVQ